MVIDYVQGPMTSIADSETTIMPLRVVQRIAGSVGFSAGRREYTSSVSSSPSQQTALEFVLKEGCS